MEPAEAVLRFLESVGRRSEAEFYLALFRGEAKERFAAIHVDASVAREAAEAVVLDLRFLATLGLFPVVVLGVFDAGEAEVHARRIARRLLRGGVPAALVADAGAAAAAARRAEIPLLTAPSGIPDRDARFEWLGGVVGALESAKLIFLSRRGGLRKRGELVGIVNLTTEGAQLAASKELTTKQRVMVAQAARLVERAPHQMTIAVTSPLDLLRELFTVKGAGTLLRRGAVIELKGGFAEVDRGRLSALLENAFGRAPVPAFFERPVSRIYLEEAYRGAAVIVDTALGAYLSKFAVERRAQGEGLGRDLWDTVAAEHPTVFWRARAQNPIGAWYTKLADGLMRFPEWHVFWRGLSPGQVPEAVAYALAAPVDIPPAEDSRE